MPGTRHDELLGPVEDALLDAGYELVALKLIPRGGGLSVQVLIDHRDGSAAVTLGDCARASRAIHERADLDRRLPGRYVLEVSSPGVDRPLTRPAHYQRFRGERVVVRLAKYVAPYRVRLLLAVLGMLGFAAMSRLSPLAVKGLINAAARLDAAITTRVT